MVADDGECMGDAIGVLTCDPLLGIAVEFATIRAADNDKFVLNLLRPAIIAPFIPTVLTLLIVPFVFTFPFTDVIPIAAGRIRPAIAPPMPIAPAVCTPADPTRIIALFVGGLRHPAPPPLLLSDGE